MTDVLEMPRRKPSPTTNPRNAAVSAARAASDKKAFDVRILEVAEMTVIADYFVIASGATERQVRTIVDEVERALGASGLKALRREGEREARWVLVDFGDVVLHVFTTEDRAYYELERLWKGAPEIAWSDSSNDSGAGAGAAVTETSSA